MEHRRLGQHNQSPGNNHPAVDAANPRANNTMGHIIRWKEDGDLDARDTMWIQTDVSTSALGQGDYAGLPNNQMLACDPTQGEIRRFLLGPAGRARPPW